MVRYRRDTKVKGRQGIFPKNTNTRQGMAAWRTWLGPDVAQPPKPASLRDAGFAAPCGGAGMLLLLARVWRCG